MDVSGDDEGFQVPCLRFRVAAHLISPLAHNLGVRRGDGASHIPIAFRGKTRAIILAAGAIRVSTYRFFIALGFFRLVRFGTEAALALVYGKQIIGWLKSDIFEYVAIFLLIVVTAGTALTISNLVRTTASGRRTAQTRHAAR